MGCRVLIVEDDADTLESIAEILTAEGHVCEGAATGAQGLALLARHRPDLVLLDVGFDGIDATRFADGKAAMDSAAAVPFVVLKSLSDFPEPDGAAATLCKPFDVEDLLETVQKFASAIAPR